MNFLSFRDNIYDWTLDTDEKVPIYIISSYSIKLTNSPTIYFKHKKSSIRA